MTSYQVENVEASARNLVHLLDVICELSFELSKGEDDERIDSLLWIARDVAEGLLQCEEKSILAAAQRNRGGSI